MPYTLVVDGKIKDIHLGGERTLAEILSEDEYQGIRNGVLIAIHKGGILSLTSRLESQEQSGTIRLLHPEDEEVQKIINATFRSQDEL